MHPRVGLNHVKENKFIHNFQYSIDPLSSCVNSIKCTILFFRHCANYTFQKQTLLNKMRAIYPNIFGRKNLWLLKCSYLENRILNIHLIKKLFTLPSVSYYQQSPLFFLYFLSWPIFFDASISSSFFSFFILY